MSTSSDYVQADTPRPSTLRLGEKPHGPENADLIEVDALDVRLPCRSFNIRYKIAEAGQHSLSSEFLLRLLKVSGDVSEETVAGFFGFDAAETAFAIGEAERRGLVSRAAGRVYLTAAGRDAFAKGGGKPHLYEVHQKRGKFDFDALSFAPAKTRPLDEFTRELSELPVSDPNRIAHASQEARDAFRRHFREFLQDRSDKDFDRKGLYAIDEVVSDRRRDEVVPIKISVTADSPDRAQTSVSEWRTGYELDSRSEVLSSVATFVSGLEVDSNWTSEDAYGALVDVVPDQASRFRRKPRFDRAAYFRNAARLVGEVQANRRTIPVVGSVWTNRNVARLGSAARLLRRDRTGGGSPIAFWLRPALSHWGSSIGLPDVAEAVMADMEIDEQGAAPPRPVCIGAGPPAPHSCGARSRRAFGRFLALPPAASPQGLEVFLVPRRLAIVLVHGTLVAGRGYPVPLGVLSVEPVVIERVHGLVSDILSRNASAQEWFGGDQAPYEMLVDALNFAAQPAATDG